MSTIIESIERRQLRRIPRFAPGDRVRVHFQVVEGTRRRTQVFEGIVIARSGSGARETFTVRKQSFGVGVERMFPVHTPKIERLEVVARGDVRRAKLYYLRGRVGKRARVAEQRWGIEDDIVIPEPEPEPVDADGVAQTEAEIEVAPSEGAPDTEQSEADPAAPGSEAAEADGGDPEQPEAPGDDSAGEGAEAAETKPAEADPAAPGREAEEAAGSDSGEAAGRDSS